MEIKVDGETLPDFMFFSPPKSLIVLPTSNQQAGDYEVVLILSDTDSRGLGQNPK